MFKFLLLLCAVSTFASQVFAAADLDLTGSVPQDGAGGVFSIEIIVTGIPNSAKLVSEANGETYANVFTLYVGSGNSEDDKLVYVDSDATGVDFWVSQRLSPKIVQDGEDWNITYYLQVQEKTGSSGALGEAISGDSLTMRAKLNYGLNAQDDYEASTVEESFTLEVSDYAANAQPQFSTIATQGTQQTIVVSFESPENIPTTDNEDVSASTLRVITISKELNEKYAASGIPGKRYTERATHTSITCTYDPSLVDAAGTSSCVSCGENGYVDTDSLASDIKSTLANVSAGKVSVGGLTNNQEYVVFMQYDPTGVQQSVCLTGVPSENISYTERNGESAAKPVKVRCFIATAAYGSGLHQHVTLFRKFRDEVLNKTPWGRMFVETYYKLSPPVADFIAEHESLRQVSRWLLSGPAAALSWMYDDERQ